MVSDCSETRSIKDILTMEEDKVIKTAVSFFMSSAVTSSLLCLCNSFFYPARLYTPTLHLTLHGSILLHLSENKLIIIIVCGCIF